MASPEKLVEYVCVCVCVCVCIFTLNNNFTTYQDVLNFYDEATRKTNSLMI